LFNYLKLQNFITASAGLPRILPDLSKAICPSALLEKGKAKKVAIVACMRKLLTIMNAILKTQKAWNYA
jgi:transposase